MDDDDFGFGASVWASSSTSVPSQQEEGPVFSSSSKISSLTDGAFDDDDFDAPVEGTTGDDDDFGDFGDAIEGGESSAFSQTSGFDTGFGQLTIQSDEWSSLRLQPTPSPSRLRDDLNILLDPLWSSNDISQFATNENIRQVGGLNQVLVTPESRSLYNALFQFPPPNDNAPTWIRSRIRRRHLVSLGIPVNLDEVLPHMNGRNMPTLQMTTRPSSAPPVQRTPALSRVASPPPGSASSSRSGTPKPGGSPLGRQSTPATTQAGLGPRPEVDEARVNQLLALMPETLSLLPLPTLEKQLQTIRSLTADTSALLTYLLQQRDALNQDSETYNGLIAELVGEAQKKKSGPRGKTRTGSLRRTSNMA